VFQSLEIFVICYRWHLKIASTFHLRRCLDFVSGTVLQLKRMSGLV
jgi:hypothetical protein